HGSGDKPLQQFALTHVDERESYPPHARVHQVHPQQARDEKVDVAGARLAGNSCAGGNGILAAGYRLQSVIHLRACQNAFRTRRVVAIFESTLAAGMMTRSYFPKRERFSAS